MPADFSMKKFSQITICFLVVLSFFLVAPEEALAQVFSLSPAKASKSIGNEFTVDVNIDTQGKAVGSADVKLTYDKDMMEVVGVTLANGTGDFFDDGAKNIATPGLIYILGTFREALNPKEGSGKVATITLKGKKAGSDQLVFACTTQTNDSNILDLSGNDLINCSGITSGVYTFSEGGEEAEPTAIPTSSGSSATATPTPPVSGISLPTISAFGIGALLTIIGLAFIF